MKKLILVLAALMLVTPAFAVDNIQLGGDFQVTGIYRSSFDFADLNNSWIMSQIRIALKADINSNVSVVASVLNERDWGTELWKTAALNNEVRFEQMYVKMTDLMMPGLNLTVGRQPFVVADGLVASSQLYRPLLYPTILGAPDMGWEKSADAIKLDYALKDGPFSLSLIKTKLYDNPLPPPLFAIPFLKDVDMYVLDVAFKAGMFSIEPYVTLLKANLGFNHWTYALLAKVTPIEGLAISGEYAMQTGDVGDLAPAWGFDASAFNLGVDYTFQGGMKPRVNVGYASFGGWNGVGTDIEAWIPVAPAGTSDRLGKIANAAIYFLGDGITTNGVRAFRAGVGVNPMEKLALDLDLFHLTADEAAVDEVGMEADLGISYSYAKDVTLGLDLNYFWAGDFFGAAADNAWQAVASVKLGF